MQHSEQLQCTISMYDQKEVQFAENLTAYLLIAWGFICSNKIKKYTHPRVTQATSNVTMITVNKANTHHAWDPMKA